MERKNDNKNQRVTFHISLRKEKEDEPLYPLDEIIHLCTHQRTDVYDHQLHSSHTETKER